MSLLFIGVDPRPIHSTPRSVHSTAQHSKPIIHLSRTYTFTTLVYEFSILECRIVVVAGAFSVCGAA